MKPNIAMDHTVVAVHHGDEVVHVLVDIEAPEVPGLERAPLDVILVLDRSGSMIASVSSPSPVTPTWFCPSITVTAMLARAPFAPFDQVVPRICRVGG